MPCSTSSETGAGSFGWQRPASATSLPVTLLCPKNKRPHDLSARPSVGLIAFLSREIDGQNPSGTSIWGIRLFCCLVLKPAPLLVDTVIDSVSGEDYVDQGYRNLCHTSHPDSSADDPSQVKGASAHACPGN